MAQNAAPDTSTWCAGSDVPESLPVIRFIGGIQLEPQIDPTGGAPSSCGLTLDLIGNLNSALAPFQPLLTLLDTVAHLAQCVLLMAEVITNPFKIPDLLACLPALIGKINKLLELVPIFPQGILAFIRFIIDVIRFVGTQIDCVVKILEAVQAQLDELGRIAQAINGTDDASIQRNLQELYDCGTEEAQKQASLALSALGPIARILCTVRAFLSFIPGGKEIQKKLAFPDPSNIEALDDAIVVLRTIRDVLLETVAVVGALAVGLGLDPPSLVFKCPLDDASDSEEDVEPTPEPSIDDVFDGNTSLPISSTPSVSIGAADLFLYIEGENFLETSKVYWSTSPIPDDKVTTRAEGTRIDVFVPAEFRTVAGEFQVSVVNEPEGGAGSTAFSGLDGPNGETGDSGVAVSNLVAVEVT